MSRQERKNMIEFINKMRGTESDFLTYMTDAEVEHIYEQTYYQFEEIAE